MILGHTTRKNFTQNPKNDILSGLTVALALVPEAVAFAFVAGVDPLVGLYGAVIMGLITALFGGRPGMISGATGAMAVVMVHLVQKGNEVGLSLDTPINNLGLQWLFITLLFVGGVQVLAGVFKLGKFVRLIPHPVMMGFVNGLAIVIFLSQIGLFQNINKDIFGNNKIETSPNEIAYKLDNNLVKDIETQQVIFKIEDNQLIETVSKEAMFTISDKQVFNNVSKQVSYTIENDGIYTINNLGVSKSFIEPNKLITMLLFVLLTMGIMFGLPKLTKKIPAALIAIIVVACITIFGNIEMSTVGSFIKDGGGSGLKGSLPTFQFQIFELFNTIGAHWDLILSTAIILAAVGLIESLMTLNLIDEMTDTRGNGNRECIAQGSANILNGLFGGMGGCAMIGQSIINVDSGGRGRLSGIIAAIASMKKQ